MQFFAADFDSEIHQKSIEIRREVLRKPLGLEYTPDQLAAEADQVHLVALEGSQVLAVALLQRIDADTAKMRQVAVALEQQGRGIGRKLVVAFEEVAREMGCRQVVLHARDSAVPFYKKQGYEIVGEGFEEVGIPHHKMQKDL